MHLIRTYCIGLEESRDSCLLCEIDSRSFTATPSMMILSLILFELLQVLCGNRPSFNSFTNNYVDNN